jgi:hypothetical protein
VHDADTARGDDEAMARRIVDHIRTWAAEDPEGCRSWLGDPADRILGAVYRRYPLQE